MIISEQDEYDERTETILKLEEWVKTLRSIQLTLEDSLATDYQMETVRQAVNGLILETVSHYKSMTN